MKHDKPWLESKNLSLRIPADLYMKLMLRSSDLGLSLQAYAIQLLEQGTEETLQKQRKPKERRVSA